MRAVCYSRVEPLALCAASVRVVEPFRASLACVRVWAGRVCLRGRCGALCDPEPRGKPLAPSVPLWRSVCLSPSVCGSVGRGVPLWLSLCLCRVRCASLPLSGGLWLCEALRGCRRGRVGPRFGRGGSVLASVGRCASWSAMRSRDCVLRCGEWVTPPRSLERCKAVYFTPSQ